VVDGHRCPIEEWSRRPHSLLPALTIDIIRRALVDSPRLSWQQSEIFVQGSYANGTNIKANSDVDLVIQLPMPFEENLDELNAEERERFFQHYGFSEYGWEDFREDVIASLRRSFFVRVGNRCITVKDWDSLVRIPADLLIAIEYRRYTAFPNLLGEEYDEGVFFRTATGTPIINYPKLHLKNGNEKDTRTGERFKQIVRAVKNARLHETVRLDPADAPSYFIECLFFNVPDACYRTKLPQAYRQSVQWLVQHADQLGDMRCQNGIVRMFGNHPEAWSIDAAHRLITALDQQCQVLSYRYCQDRPQ
jgi:hypothetical protein